MEAGKDAEDCCVKSREEYEDRKSSRSERDALRDMSIGDARRKFSDARRTRDSKRSFRLKKNLNKVKQGEENEVK